MAVFQSGPVNLEQGNSTVFNVEYLSSTGDLTVPSTGLITVTYTNTSNTSQSDSVALSNSGSIFSGTWSSTSAALGLATWVATMTGSATTQATGQIRVIQRQSTY